MVAWLGGLFSMGLTTLSDIFNLYGRSTDGYMQGATRFTYGVDGPMDLYKEMCDLPAKLIDQWSHVR